VLALDVQVKQCRIFSVTAGDLLPLDISLVCLD